MSKELFDSVWNVLGLERKDYLDLKQFSHFVFVSECLLEGFSLPKAQTLWSPQFEESQMRLEEDVSTLHQESDLSASSKVFRRVVMALVVLESIFFLASNFVMLNKSLKERKTFPQFVCALNDSLMSFLFKAIILSIGFHGARNINKASVTNPSFFLIYC